MSNQSRLTIGAPNDDSEQEISVGVYVVPLLWFALFRAEDIAPGSCIPATTVEKALNQLSSAVPMIESMFPDQAISEHARILSSALAAHQNGVVTIDFEEIECLDEDQARFRAMVRYAIQSMDGRVPAPVGRAALLDLSGFASVDPIRRGGCLIGDVAESDFA